MNAIQTALNELTFRIPIEVLVAAFRDREINYNAAPFSLDEQIRLKVINPRVLMLANLVGGQEATINLAGLTPEYLDDYSALYRVPSSRLNNRTIISVLNISYIPMLSAMHGYSASYGLFGGAQSNDIVARGERIADSISAIPSVCNAMVDLVGVNTIRIIDSVRLTQAYQLTCVMTNDSDLNNISPRSYLHFAKLVELAVKSYIYSRLHIFTGKARLEGGQELGEFKDMVDGYSSAEEEFQTYLKEVWGRVAGLNDPKKRRRALRLQFPTNL